MKKLAFATQMTCSEKSPTQRNLRTVLPNLTVHCKKRRTREQHTFKRHSQSCTSTLARRVHYEHMMYKTFIVRGHHSVLRSHHALNQCNDSTVTCATPRLMSTKHPNTTHEHAIGSNVLATTRTTVTQVR